MYQPSRCVAVCEYLTCGSIPTAEESEEEDEEPILKFEHEPLEAGETVLVPDGSEGVIENIRRGNVVVRTETALETFKLEEVRRKNIAPPGYVPPQRTKKEKTGPTKEERDLSQAWAAMEDKYNRLVRIYPVLV